MSAKSTSIDLFQEIKDEISSGNLRQIYFLCGDETFFCDELQNEFLKLIPPDMRDFNYNLMYGNEHTIQQVIGVARSFPMMSERRLVIVREFHALFDRRLQVVSDEVKSQNEKAGDTYTASFEPIIQYAENPNPSTILVLVDKKAPAGNTKFGSLLNKSNSAKVAKFESIPDFKLPDWIIDWCLKVYNKKIDPRAAQLAAQYTGSNLLLMSKELDKLCTFQNKSDSISTEDVKKIVNFSRQISAFELKDALFSRNLPKTLQIAEQLLHNSETTDVGEVMRTISFLYSLFSNIWQIQRLTAKGIPSRQIQSQLGVKSDYYFRNLVKESQVFPAEHMPVIFESILDADKALKGMGKSEAKDVFFLMLQKIIG